MFNQSYNTSVHEYARKFNGYTNFCPNMVPDEGAKAQKFEDGFQFEIQTRLGGRHSLKLTQKLRTLK